MSLSRLSRDRVATVAPGCTIAEAARRMTMLSVGALVIAHSPVAAPAGIVTDRDLVERIGEGADPKAETVARFAGRGVETVGVGEPTRRVLAAMREHGVRRMPIVDDPGRLAGMVSLDDVLLALGEEMADDSRAYPAGRRDGLQADQRPLCRGRSSSRASHARRALARRVLAGRTRSGSFSEQVVTSTCFILHGRRQGRHLLADGRMPRA